MQCYTELIPPTAVTYSVALPFTSASSNNLVVAKGSLLQIFSTKVISTELDTSQSQPKQSTKPTENYDRRLNDDDGLESSFLGGDGMLIRADRSTSTKLVLVAEYQIHGEIAGLARVKIQDSKSGGEALLVHSRVARLSLVQWDPEKNGIDDISIHYYEKDEYQGAPFSGPLRSHDSLLAADPQSRCAALKFGLRYLAFLPFRQSDEDIDMDDWDEDMDGPRPVREQPASSSLHAANGSSSSLAPVPYTASFVLPLPQLDPDLLHPVHFAFLHEYREPTFGIVSSTKRRSHQRANDDHFTYKVFTIDLQHKTSTSILAVAGLPQDIFKVVPMPSPVGGALLVGENELIHIDQSGKTNGVAVNPFTKDTTNFSLADQSDLGLRLEHCNIEVMSPETGDLLMVLMDGRLAIVSFKIDGRTVSGVTVKMVSPENGGDILTYRASCMTKLGKNSIFVGSIGSDSTVVGWTRKQTQATKKKARLLDDGLDYDLDDEDMEEDEDDIYGDGPVVPQQTADGKTGRSGEATFRVHDSLLSLAPIMDMCAGKAGFAPDREEAKNSEGVVSDLQLACIVGRDKAGSLALVNQNIQPKVIGKFDFPEARGFWTTAVQKPMPKALQAGKGASMAGAGYDVSGQYDKFMIVSKVDLDGYETSDVYALTGAGFEALSGTEFDPVAGLTIEAGTMGKGMRIIQVLKSEVRCYDGDLGLSQILPMLDEETGAEPRVISASIADPYLLLVREDSSILVAAIDKNNELEEVDKVDETLTSVKWLSGCLYKDTHGVFSPLQTDKGSTDAEDVFMFLLSATGALYIYGLPDLSKPLYVAVNLSYVPPVLSADQATRRGTQQETITEVLVANLGDIVSATPHLILRHANDDLTIYNPFRVTKDGSQAADLSKTLFFQKSTNPHMAKGPEEVADDEAEQQPRFIPLRACANIGGLSAVFLPGGSPSFIVKSAKSAPHVVGLQGLGVRGLSPFHTEGCERGFIYADSAGRARVTQLAPVDDIAQHGLSIRKVALGGAVDRVAYHPTTETYAIACSVSEPFELPRDDDYHKEWAKENAPMAPMCERGVVRLISPQTWTVIDSFDLDPCEVIMSMKTLNLEVSEETRERRMLIAVGTGILRGEDLPCRGRLLVLDVVPVIPQPGRPETDRKLKLVAKEEIPRGAVTALSEVGSQGLMLVAQGQKCMVRGLKEDGTLLPVAFMDMSTYVTAVHEVPGTGYCLMADALMGVWFVGYSEEPYRMTLFGKSSTKLRCLTADFLVSDNDLSIVVSDEDGVLHILQFDPEHPRSLQGHVLLCRASFSLAPNPPTQTLNLPLSTRTNPTTNSQVLLLSSPSGSLSLLTPVSEHAYRRLTSLASSLGNSLTHAAGMNPKGHRFPPQDSATRAPAVDVSAGRTIVDGTLLVRWNELSARQRAEAAGKGGYGSPLDARAELEGVLGWGSMAYF
ncbi:CPSF A subunit region-domain-containing protein [Plectosphaerella plurivora]|uniref:CPSF A subunit region-domain-containing protein n=1 Tax=Plectosphaerella plurivora TaxID=936078 RepID=A0A9P9AF77_9PEZI|nr:CPSF A subunit region-domain-containing protein [Plectosphaerella plurivora]